MTYDLINRQAVLDKAYELDLSDTGNDIRVLVVDVAEVKKLPTAEKKGKWEEKQDSDWAGGGAWVCSECGFGYAFGAYHEAYEFNYCPNCGARMEGEDE